VIFTLENMSKHVKSYVKYR